MLKSLCSMLVVALVFAVSGDARAQQFFDQPIPRPKHLTEPVWVVPKAPQAQIVDVTPVPSSSDQSFQPPVRTFADEATPVPEVLQPVKPITRQWTVVQHTIPAGWERDQFGKFVWKEQQVTERWVEVTPQPVAESKPIRHQTIYPNWDAEMERLGLEREDNPRTDSSWQSVRPRTQVPATEESLPRRLPIPQPHTDEEADRRPTLQPRSEPQRNEQPSIRFTGPSTLVRLKPINN